MPNHLTRAYRTLTNILFKRSILAFLPLSGGWGVILALAFLPLSECWAVEQVTAGPGKRVASGYGQGHWRRYGIPEGLSGTRIHSIIQDREGLLWFGTFDGGVSRFDGETFTTFTTQDGLAGNTVMSIVQDREGSRRVVLVRHQRRCESI